MRQDVWSDSVGRKLAFLAGPGAYPEGTTRVERVETHMSWVFLTDTRAYKLKKPVDLPHHALDLRQLSQRLANCREELRLNRRLAPDVYLDLVTLTRDDHGKLALGGGGVVVDWLVVMKRLPSASMLDRAIEDGRVDTAAVREAVRGLSRMYREGGPALLDATEYRLRLEEELAADEAELAARSSALPAGRVRALTCAQRALLRRRPELFDARVEAGRIVEGHGDLRPEHVCLDPVAIIDCMEFDQALRTLDAADDVGYLALECERLGAPEVGVLAFRVYAEETGDRPPAELLRFHRRYRALRRARVALWHLDDASVPDRERWVARAHRYLELGETPSPLEELHERLAPVHATDGLREQRRGGQEADLRVRGPLR